MATNYLEAVKMLDAYIHDYLRKRKFNSSAKVFKVEGNVSTDAVATDAPEGVLLDWWYAHWDTLTRRKNVEQSELVPTADVEAEQNTKEKHLQMQQSKLMDLPHAQRDPKNYALGGPRTALNSGEMMGQPSGTMKMFEEHMKHPHSMDPKSSSALRDGDRMTHLESGSSHHSQLAQGNYGNIATLKELKARIALSQKNQERRKRIEHSSSGTTESTGTGNTICGSLCSPQSNHTPGNRINTGLPKSLMNYGPEGTPARTFSAAGGMQKNNSKLTCCDFSSDGKFLATAGHDKNAALLRTDNMQPITTTPILHTAVITDVRFRPNSTQLVTASYDSSLRFWDAANPDYCFGVIKATSPVLSLDFHPKKTSLFCFCGLTNEIFYWNIGSPSYVCRFEGGNYHVRFQPRTGNLLAATSDNVLSIFDVETGSRTQIFQGHSEIIKDISWNYEGNYLVSVSQSLGRVWSIASRSCVHEFSTNKNQDQFHSCIFHPRYSPILVIGGSSPLELRNARRGETFILPIKGHSDVVTALAQSPASGMVASASYDGAVRLWK